MGVGGDVALLHRHCWWWTGVALFHAQQALGLWAEAQEPGRGAADAPRRRFLELRGRNSGRAGASMSTTGAGQDSETRTTKSKSKSKANALRGGTSESPPFLTPDYHPEHEDEEDRTPGQEAMTASTAGRGASTFLSSSGAGRDSFFWRQSVSSSHRDQDDASPASDGRRGGPVPGAAARRRGLLSSSRRGRSLMQTLLAHSSSASASANEAEAVAGVKEQAPPSSDDPKDAQKGAASGARPADGDGAEEQKGGAGVDASAEGDRKEPKDDTPASAEVEQGEGHSPADPDRHTPPASGKSTTSTSGSTSEPPKTEEKTDDAGTPGDKKRSTEVPGHRRGSDESPSNGDRGGQGQRQTKPERHQVEENSRSKENQNGAAQMHPKWPGDKFAPDAASQTAQILLPIFFDSDEEDRSEWHAGGQTRFLSFPEAKYLAERYKELFDTYTWKNEQDRNTTASESGSKVEGDEVDEMEEMKTDMGKDACCGVSTQTFVDTIPKMTDHLPTNHLSTEMLDFQATNGPAIAYTLNCLRGETEWQVHSKFSEPAGAQHLEPAAGADGSLHSSYLAECDVYRNGHITGSYFPWLGVGQELTPDSDHSSRGKDIRANKLGDATESQKRYFRKWQRVHESVTAMLLKRIMPSSTEVFVARNVPRWLMCSVEKAVVKVAVARWIEEKVERGRLLQLKKLKSKGKRATEDIKLQLSEKEETFEKALRWYIDRLSQESCQSQERNGGGSGGGPAPDEGAEGKDAAQKSQEHNGGGAGGGPAPDEGAEGKDAAQKSQEHNGGGAGGGPAPDEGAEGKDAAQKSQEHNGGGAGGGPAPDEGAEGKDAAQKSQEHNGGGAGGGPAPDEGDEGKDATQKKEPSFLEARTASSSTTSPGRHKPTARRLGPAKPRSIAGVSLRPEEETEKLTTMLQEESDGGTVTVPATANSSSTPEGSSNKTDSTPADEEALDPEEEDFILPGVDKNHEFLLQLKDQRLAFTLGLQELRMRMAELCHLLHLTREQWLGYVSETIAFNSRGTSFFFFTDLMRLAWHAQPLADRVAFERAHVLPTAFGDSKAFAAYLELRERGTKPRNSLLGWLETEPGILAAAPGKKALGPHKRPVTAKNHTVWRLAREMVGPEYPLDKVEEHVLSLPNSPIEHHLKQGPDAKESADESGKVITKITQDTFRPSLDWIKENEPIVDVYLARTRKNQDMQPLVEALPELEKAERRQWDALWAEQKDHAAGLERSIDIPLLEDYLLYSWQCCIEFLKPINFQVGKHGSDKLPPADFCDNILRNDKKALGDDPGHHDGLCIDIKTRLKGAIAHLGVSMVREAGVGFHEFLRFVHRPEVGRLRSLGRLWSNAKWETFFGEESDGGMLSLQDPDGKAPKGEKNNSKMKNNQFEKRDWDEVMGQVRQAHKQREEAHACKLLLCMLLSSLSLLALVVVFAGILPNFSYRKHTAV